MSGKFRAACFVALTGTVMFITTPAHAAGASVQESSMASFEGHSIDLAQGWGKAHACLIWRQHGIAECFRTEAQLSTRLSQARASSHARPASGVPTCSSSLDLYSARNYGGQHLALYDEGYWQELSYDGFDNVTMSFLGGACSFHLAQGNWGQGYWYPGNTGAWSAAADMGSWNNTVSSVYIN